MTAVERALDVLRARAHGRITPGGAIAPLTTYRLGGPAAILFEPSTGEDLVALADALDASELPLLVVGRGSNMLVSDRGFDGIVVRLGSGFRWARRDDDGIAAGAAMPLPALATMAMHEGLAGFGFAVAIPASLGGAVRMNAGAHGSEMSDVLDWAELFALSARATERVAAADLGLSYRRSSVAPDRIVTGARLQLPPGAHGEIVAAMDEAKEWRRATQPLNLPNGGSVFTNPPGEAAGALIERICGKGMRVGGASISEVHANFIVADDGARADEVFTLLRRIQRAVAAETGIELEPELKLIGAFQEVDDGTS